MRRTVLCVDDDRINRMLLQKILSDEYEVLEASDGQEAMRVLNAQADSLSAVFLDLIMPVMDGYEVLSAMRAQENLSQIPVIITTGDQGQETEMKALMLGANDFALKPYNPSILKRRLWNVINLRETSAIVNATRVDALTGLLSRSAFFEKAEQMIQAHEPGYYVMACFDVDRFKVINDQYGNQRGDAVLKFIADTFDRGFSAMGGICCRVMADDFATLYPASYMTSEEITEIGRTAAGLGGALRPITFSIGRYLVDDLSLTPSAMFDRASLAEASIKGRYDVHVAMYDESMRGRILREQEIISEMDAALANHNFEVWFQPQYNHSSGALVGAEALVRWRHPERGLISPGEFIPVFERNGFIYELDKYVWEQTCVLLKRWREEGRDPVPVSVNISRVDVFRKDLIDVITGLIRQYEIPVELLRLEVTESAFSESTDQIITVVNTFVSLGFTVEIDDFGSGYSSLNTLKDVPAQVLKLDMRFLEGEDNSARGGNILESIIRMAKWLNMAVIAEGVETLEQADYLKSVGCSYIQGYFYAKPMPAAEFEKAARHVQKEARLFVLKTVESLDNNRFWNPDSLETLVFNSYVGGACVFELYHGKAEIIRINGKYAQVIGGKDMTVEDALHIRWEEHLEEDSHVRFRNAIQTAHNSHDEVTEELLFLNLPGCPEKVYLRSTFRVIASAGDRLLIYCMNENVTKQREAEQKEQELSAQMRAIMSNINGGVSAVVLGENGDDSVRFLFANQRFYRMLGYTRAQYEREVSNPFAPVHPEDRERVVEQTRNASRVRRPFHILYRAICRNQSVIWVQSNVSITNLEGVREPVQITVSTDITAQRELEQSQRKTAEQMQAIMDHVESGITAAIIHNGKVEFLFANDKYYSIFGFTREEYRLEVNSTYDLIHPEDREHVQQQAEETLQTGVSRRLVYRARRRDGREIYIRILLSIAHFDGVDMPVQLSVVRDVTTEMQAQEQIRQTDDQLRFLNEIAHDLLAQTDSDLGITQVLQKLLHYFDGNRVYIFELDDAHQSLSNTYEVCAQGVIPQKEQLQHVPISVMSYWVQAFETANYLSIENVDQLGADRMVEKQMLQAQDIHSLMAVPLRRNGKWIGFIGMDDPGKKQTLVERFVALGDYIAVMLTRRDLDQKIQRDTKMLRNLMNDTPGGFARIRISADGMICKTYVNEGYCKMLGLSEEMVMEENRQDAFGRIHPDDLTAVRTIMGRIHAKGQSAKVKFRLRHQNGTYLWFWAFGRVCKWESGEVYLNTYYTELTDDEIQEMEQGASL